MLKKVLNIVIVLSLLSFLVGASMLWYKPFSGINNLDFTLFSFVLAFSAFTIRIFIGQAEIISYLKWSILILLLLPVIIVTSALFEPNVLENSWPLLISTIVFQGIVALLSLLHVFNRNQSVARFTKLVVAYAILFCLATMVIVLLKVPNAMTYTLLLLGLILLFALFLINYLLHKKNAQ